MLRGLGTPGRAGLPAVRAGGGSRVRLTRITLEAAGRGVQLDQPGPLDIEGLTADHATGDVIRVVAMAASEGSEYARVQVVSMPAASATASVSGRRPRRRRPWRGPASPAR